MKACDYGGLTIRNRVFAVSVLNDNEFIFPQKEKSLKCVRDILFPPAKDCLVEKMEYIDTSKDYTKAIKIKDYNNGGQGNRIYSINGQGITLTATGGGKGGSSELYLREEGVYKLSGAEMARLMGWSLEDAKKMNQVANNRDLGFCLGNAIDLSVLSKLAKEINNQYFREKK